MENVSFRILRMCIFVYATELQIVQLSSLPDPCPDDADNTIIGENTFIVKTMVENISLLFTGICVFLSITDMQNVKLQTIPNPCPDVTPQSTIADMCTSDYAKEENQNGGTTVDSVAVRVMTQLDGCICEVSLQNQYNTHTIYMRKYDLKTSTTPEHEACGLVIDIDYTISNIFPENKASIECTKGTFSRSVSLSQNGVLNLRSRIIGGSFSRGYCIQIYRQHITSNNIGIQINCSHPNMQDNTVSTNMQTTQQVTDSANHDNIVSEKDNIRVPAIIAIVIGWCLIALFVLTACYLYRRKRKQQPNIAVEENVNPQYEDLNATRLSSCYSSLNAPTVTSVEEQYEHIGHS